nr:MAG: chorismate synthase [Bacteroidota bacterium]
MGAFLQIRTLTHPDEIALIEELQARIWPGSAVNIVPGHVLLIHATYGGLVAAAFASPDPFPVGFVYGFPALEPDPEGGWRLKHCSHMLGVLESYRDRGVGFALKRFQRDFVRAQGIELITWTFDPLESRNARLNLRRLGGIARFYKRDAYGRLQDALNRDLPTDRLEVEWWIEHPRVRARLAGMDPEPEIPPVLNRVDTRAPIPYPTDWHWPPEGERVSVCLPARLRAFRGQDPERDLAWRLHLRQILETAFEQGWALTDYLLAPDGLWGYYVLEPQERLHVPRRNHPFSDSPAA